MVDLCTNFEVDSAFSGEFAKPTRLRLQTDDRTDRQGNRQVKTNMLPFNLVGWLYTALNSSIADLGTSHCGFRYVGGYIFGIYSTRQFLIMSIVILLSTETLKYR